ncbi:ATP-binding cassette domain-containing protein [Kitasatospora sp. NPDC058444]|uniref:ABC transporter ATP-binding protein n=1 Tax=Kitasatospora sp. NPDC058444 TaxID=3346504 RepID=UPI00364B99D3
MIRARELSKTYHTVVRPPGLKAALRSLVAPRRVARHAVRELSFDIPPGQLVSLLGPNGAGKSTAIKLLTGILVPTSGEVRVAGLVPHRNRERNAHRVGVVFGQRTQLWWDLPARHSLMVLRDIYGVDRASYDRRLRTFDDLLGLSGFWDTRVRHLSLGQRVRCDLAAALLHDPPVLFLDEPTIGMDVVVKEQVRDFLRAEVHERGRTVLLTTHDMTEVARLSARVLVVNGGRLVLDGPLEEIRRRFGGSWRIRVTLADPAHACGPPPGVRLLRRDGPVAVFGPNPGSGSGRPPLDAQDALGAIVRTLPVAGVAVEEDDLEDVMRAVYRSGGSDDGGDGSADDCGTADRSADDPLESRP